MSYIQNYPLLPPLEKITRHDQLPSGAKQIGQLRRGSLENNPNYVFVKRGNNLSILITYVTERLGNREYICDQYDFPLKVLPWFPKALDEFRKPPSAGGLHAGAMISRDQDVGGEMLAVGSTTRGYDITNWSRHAKGVNANPQFYRPTDLSLDYELLYDYGLLNFWKSLGEKYERGEI